MNIVREYYIPQRVSCYVIIQHSVLHDDPHEHSWKPDIERVSSVWLTKPQAIYISKFFSRKLDKKESRVTSWKIYNWILPDSLELAYKGCITEHHQTLYCNVLRLTHTDSQDWGESENVRDLWPREVVIGVERSAFLCIKATDLRQVPASSDVSLGQYTVVLQDELLITLFTHT